MTDSAFLAEEYEVIESGLMWKCPKIIFRQIQKKNRYLKKCTYYRILDGMFQVMNTHLI